MSAAARRRDPARRGGLVALAVAAAGLFPALYLLFLSFAGPYAFPRLWPASFTLARWTGLLAGEAGLAASLGASLLLSAAVALAATLLGFVTARSVATHPWRRLLLFLAGLPFVVSPAVLATCLLHVYLRLHLAGTWLGVGLSQLILAYGFAVVFFQGFWNAETRALGDLVATLGGTERQLFLRVYWPLGRGQLAIAFFQAFLLSYFQYGATVLIGGGQVRTLTLAVYHFVGEANPGYAAVAGCLLVLPPFLLLWLNRGHLLRPPA